MRPRTLAYAAAAGLVMLLAVTVAVSEVLRSYVEFSTVIGIPVGVTVAAVVAALVLVLAGREDVSTRRGVALGLGTAGVAFFVVYVVALAVLMFGVAISIGTAALLGALAGMAVYVLYR